MQIAYVAKLAHFMMLFFTKSDVHNCLNCILFYAFNYVKSTKVSCQYFTVAVENIVSLF